MRTSSLIVVGVFALGLPVFAQKATSGASSPNTGQNQNYSNQNSGNPVNRSSQQSSSTSRGQEAQQSAAAQRHNASGMPGQRAKESEEAADLLAAASQARTAVLDYDKQDALEHVNHAIEKAQALMQQKPGRFVPIYDELSHYSVVEPVMQSRNQRYQEENQQSEQNNASSASQPSQQNSVARNDELPLGVESVTGSFTSIGLDVKAAQDHLIAAKQALQNGDFGTADAALKAVQDGVDVASISVDLPLLQARENLMLARQSAMNGDQRETRAALRDAARALRDYARTGGTHSNQASALCTQIENASNTRAQGAQYNSTNASESQIANWWDQVASWSQAAHS